mgnify:CR=1 FL=1
MSINLPTHYVQQFSTNVQLLLQQRGSKLRNLVLAGSHVGKQASPVDQFGAVTANKVTGRFNAMPRVDAATDRRWVFPADYDLPQLIDTFDKLRLITDPQSAYVTNAVYAMGRAMDDEIIDAFFGDAKTGEQGGTTTALPAAQKIAINFGAAGSVGLTVAKLREAKRLLMAAEVDLDSDPLTCVVTAKQHDNLLAEAQVVSTDFNDKPVLVEGRVTRFLGINIVHCERLDVDASSDRLVPVYAKSGVYLGNWMEIHTSVSKRNDLQGEPWQVYALGTFGATRLEEKKVVQITCDE